MALNDRNGSGAGEYIGKHRHSGGYSGAGKSKTAPERQPHSRQGLVVSGTGTSYAPRNAYGNEGRGYRDAGVYRASYGQSRTTRLIKLLLLCFAVLFGLYYITVTVTLSGVNTLKYDTDWEDRPASSVSGMALESSSAADIILIIGTDGDGSAGSRSDTIMYASVNKLTGKVRLCSVLRDCYVEIPGHKAAKINSAFSQGADELCMRTMESNFRIRTKKYIRVNTEALITAIDEIGGVELDLSADEARAVNSHFAPGTAVEGKQVLGGKYAVYFARIRKTDDDFHRVSRQRVLISAIGRKCIKTSPFRLCSAVNKAAPYITTNISSSQLSWLGIKIALAMSTGNCEQMTIPADGTWNYQEIDGQSCISMDVRANAELARRFLLYRD